MSESPIKVTSAEKLKPDAWIGEKNHPSKKREVQVTRALPDTGNDVVVFLKHCELNLPTSLAVLNNLTSQVYLRMNGGNECKAFSQYLAQRKRQRDLQLLFIYSTWELLAYSFSPPDQPSLLIPQAGVKG